MAAPIAIAIRRQAATDRIIESAGSLAKRLGLEMPDLTPTNKDPALQQAMQLEAFAEALEMTATAVAEMQRPVKVDSRLAHAKAVR